MTDRHILLQERIGHARQAAAYLLVAAVILAPSVLPEPVSIWWLAGVFVVLTVAILGALAGTLMQMSRRP